MSDSWPQSWQGQTHLDCGDDGQAFTLLTTLSQPTAIHEKNFQLIAARWSTIWPEFRRIITELMESYRQDQPDWQNLRALYLALPDEPIAEDAEWTIGVVFSVANTLWMLPYRGWSSVRGEAQAIW